MAEMRRRLLPKEPKHDPATQSSDLLVVLRALTGPGLIFAGWQIVPLSFTGGTIIAYVGIALLLIECMREPWLIQKPYQIQVVCIGIVFLFFDLFTINVAFVRAPLVFNSTWIEPNHVVAATGGIAWNPFFAELDITFSNPQTDATYDDFNVLVRPDRPVAGISQLSNLFDVSFEDRYGLSLHTCVEDAEANVVLKNLEFIATDAGYKIHCAHIPPNASLRIVMATVEMKKALPRPPIAQSILPESIFVVPTFADKDGSKSSYWYGSRGYAGRFLPPTSPTKITVRGSFVGNHRPRTVDREIEVGKGMVFE